MAFQAALGSVVLLRTGIRRFSPAVVNAITPDGRFNLTVFEQSGSTSPANGVVEGDNVGNWVAPGVEQQEAAMAKAPPVSEKGTLKDLAPKGKI